MKAVFISIFCIGVAISTLLAQNDNKVIKDEDMKIQFTVPDGWQATQKEDGDDKQPFPAAGADPFQTGGDVQRRRAERSPDGEVDPQRVAVEEDLHRQAQQERY